MVLLWDILNGRRGHDAAWQLLTQLYRQETGCPLPEIHRTPQGKPFIPGSALHISLSHTQTHAFCCISRRNIGIDAESIHRAVPPRLAARWLSPGELQHYTAAKDPQDCFLRLWVLKESYAKLTGRGWGDYLKYTDFDPYDPRIQIIDGHYVAVMEEGEPHAL